MLRIRIQKAVKSNIFVATLAASVIVGSIGITSMAASTSTGYVICVNNQTRALTFPAKNKLTCPSGNTKIVMGAQGAQGLQGKDGLIGPKGDMGLQGAQGIPGLQGIQGLSGKDGLSGTPGASGSPGVPGPTGVSGMNQLQSIMQAVVPKTAAAMYTVTCGLASQTAVGISVPVSQAQNLHSSSLAGFQSLAVANSNGFEGCLNQVATITQNGGFSATGKIIEIDKASGLILVASPSVLHTLSPASVAPNSGDFIFTAGGNNSADAGASGVGMIHHVMPDREEEAYTAAGGNSSAVVVNANGDFIHIASHKPGVLCRIFITCGSGSPYLAWSRPIAFVLAPPTNISATVSGATKTIHWMATAEQTGLVSYTVVIKQLGSTGKAMLQPYMTDLTTAQAAYDLAQTHVVSAKTTYNTALAAYNANNSADNLNAKTNAANALTSAQSDSDRAQANYAHYQAIVFQLSNYGDGVINRDVARDVTSLNFTLDTGYELIPTYTWVIANYASGQSSTSSRLPSNGVVL